MKIDVVGNMCTWTKELSTSFIINDEILFDTPQSSFKTLLNDYDLKKIKYIIISHFHSDHFGDLHLVLDYIFNHTKNNLTIIAPKGCKERLFEIFKIFEVSYFQKHTEERVSFIDCENNKIIKLGQYKIKCFKMLHKDLDAYGFTIENENKVVGFSGDSAMCNNIRKILKKSQVAFIDSANVAVDNKHLCTGEVNELCKEFADCKIYAVHLAPHSLAEAKYIGLNYAKQGEIVEI